MSALFKTVPGNTPQGKEEKTLATGDGIRRKNSAGVADGLSMYEKFDSGSAEASPDQNFTVDPANGFSPERLKPRDAKAVSGKDGKFWLIG